MDKVLVCVNAGEDHSSFTLFSPVDIRVKVEMKCCAAGCCLNTQLIFHWHCNYATGLGKVQHDVLLTH